jgi:hypothetical protein
LADKPWHSGTGRGCQVVEDVEWQSRRTWWAGFGYHECRRIYAEPTPKAARKLIELIGSDDERVALRHWQSPGNPVTKPDGTVVRHVVPDQQLLASIVKALDDPCGVRT